MAENLEPVTDITNVGWKRPDEFMKLHLLKKKRALNARLCKEVLPPPTTPGTTCNDVFEKRDLLRKRKNPFRCETNKRFKGGDNLCEISSSELENSNDTTLFQLITASETSENKHSNELMQTSFSSILSKLKGETTDPIVHNENNYIPVDWSLKSKIRLMSEKPFPWDLLLKACEEASGITGFVRCVNSGLSPEKNNGTTCSLDTSPNARFLQCCLIWQYPSFPWLSVFPRTAGRVSSTSASFIGSNPELRESLYNEWRVSLRSLYQLVRALQCPYFYVCANNFTCLFRAAGIGGKTDIHAFITPTTSGFRQLLKNEDVEYTMPLRKSKPTKRLSSDSNSDTGYDTLDSITDDQSQSSFSKTSAVNEEIDDDDDDDETADEWLKSMGMEASEIKKLNAHQEKLVSDRSREVDHSSESLVYVEGFDVQALFNFLNNCKTIVSSTGPLAGIPPTLLAPVAFRGAHLKPFKVQQSRVKVDTKSYYSIEIRGPILPHTVHNLCGLIKQKQSFSMTFAHVESTKPFSEVASAISSRKETAVDISVKTPEKIGNSTTVHTPTKTPASGAFCKENLSDCGLHHSLIDSFCSPDMYIRVVDSLRSNVDGTYCWS
ncbi:hypothetical protein R5R35_001321 [Gryllus longicercus]|uniref:Protein downstream neighbor of son homolog n=1 Tax=Gryllus longicercus TaxID=2509291 RepID=A0AAN9VP80_9ORTH